MKFRQRSTFVVVLSILLFTILMNVFVSANQTELRYTSYDLVIKGLVGHPHNFTYDELQRFPTVSEVALMECVGGYTQLYNWTGTPLFFLLSVTGIESSATEIIFYASDGFSSSLSIERALHPTTLLAFQANGTMLSDFDGGPYRLVVPCKYGYKWVRWITEIEVVNYDYKGYYETMGYSDEADIPDCTLPSTTPPSKTFQLILGSTTYTIITLSNSTIDSIDFDASQKQVSFNVTGPTSTESYCYITIPKTLLWCDRAEQWQVRVNNTLIEDKKTLEDTDYTYLYFTFNGTHKVQIEGVHAIFDLLGDLNSDGTVDIFDVVTVAKAFGSGVEDLDWNPTADLNSDDVVDIFDVVLIAQNFGKTA